MIRFRFAPRLPAQSGFPRALTMTFLWALLALLHVLPGTVAPAHAQGSRKDDIVFNSRGIPLAGATVRVCTMPATGQPCTPLALIYSDSALTQALANPTTTDGLGNYFFYAAPGTYEIEISGPQITTKQIPNVILPNDPSSPTFTGGISAFSLTLSGNLTVNGSTTVIGNLASGTLNLSNQSSPPGAANSGTVNLYTKTADKRLYYKDDTGTETGPLLPGASTSVTNTFTADQNFDGNTYPKGPNPYIDMARYGGYYGTNAGTTASCTNGSANVTLASAQDFLDASRFPGTGIGSGIVLYTCGAPTGLSTAPAPTITPFGLTGGATTYNYKWVAEDTSGGLTAASSAGSTTTGVATLGLNTVALASAVGNSTANGEQVYTCQATCNLSVYTPIFISGFATPRLNGNYTIIATTSTTFTVYSPGSTSAISEVNSAATVKVLACNILTGPANMVPNTVENGTTDLVMRWFVYRNNTLAFIIPRRDPYYEDCGVNTPSSGFPPYVPSSPGSAVNKYLATTIVSGGGTTSIVVANSAGNTVSGVSALHDNSQNLRAALAAGRSSTQVRVNGGAVFNAATVFDSSHGSSAQVWAPVGVVVNQPWVVRIGISFKGGESATTTSFTYRPQVPFIATGYAYPGMLGLLINSVTYLNAVTIENFSFNANNLTQIPFVYDQDGAFGLMMINDSFSTSNSSSNLNTPAAWITGVTHSVFGRDGDEWSCAVPQTILAPPCIRFTTESPASAGTGFLSLVEHSTMHGGNMQGGTSFQFDAFPCYFSPGCTVSNSTGMQLEMKTMLGEERWGPFIRMGPYVGATNIRMSLVDDDAPNASPGNGFIDAAANGGTFFVDNLSSSVTGQVLLDGPGYVVASNLGLPIGTTLSSTLPAGGWTSLGGTGVQTAGGNAALQAFGAAGVGYGFPVPNTPTIVTGAHNSCASNCVASGTYFYAIVANDITGKNSALSGCSSSVTVDGTQTVTVTWVPIQGQYTTQRYRGSACNTVLSTDALGFGVNGISYVDLGSYGYSSSPPASIPGNAVAMNSSGLSSNQLTLVGGGFSDTVAPLSAGFTANRSQIIPDLSGYVPVTSYVNSAYDNATRANGAIGSNWTVANNGINISSNNFVGTAAINDVAFWNASPFSNNQFSQVTLTALNGTTDFPGVAVLLSGSGASTQGYECVEDTTNIFIQKITGTGNTTLTSAASSGVPGDILRLEATQGGNLTCFKNGVSTLTTTDTTYTTGSPGLFLFGTVATSKNWSGGNLHPITQLDTEQDWTRTQHFTQGIALGGASSESLNNNPRAEQNIFLPGALTSTWTGSTWTNDKPVTITRVQVQAKTAPSGCSTNAIVRLTDGTTPVNVTISAAANDSGALSQNYAAGSSLTISLQTAAAGCTTSPADANVTVQYRMQ